MMYEAITKLQNTMNFALTMKSKCEWNKDIIGAKEWEARYQALKVACMALRYLKA